METKKNGNKCDDYLRKKVLRKNIQKVSLFNVNGQKCVLGMCVKQHRVYPKVVFVCKQGENMHE